ncbi:MAG: TM2 domain-containing protein [Pedosphaera sp.]|nr:TM2 domain-containing protein [Pedosphaera sp.]
MTTEANAGKSGFYPTFFLCLFLGVFGVHRFYNRKLGTGVLQLVTFGGLGFWVLVDLLMVLLGKFKDKGGVPIINVNPKMSWMVVAVVIIIGVASGSSEKGTTNDSSSSQSISSHGNSSTSVSASDVAGRWVGEYQGLTAMDITLFPNGSYVSSSGDFAGGQVSSGSWRLSGNRVTVQLSDGSPLSFTYSGGRLVAGNGRPLNRR